MEFNEIISLYKQNLPYKVFESYCNLCSEATIQKYFNKANGLKILENLNENPHRPWRYAFGIFWKQMFLSC